MDGTLWSDDVMDLLYDKSDPETNSQHESDINSDISEDYENALNEGLGEGQMNDTKVQIHEANQDSVDEKLRVSDTEERDTHLHDWREWIEGEESFCKFRWSYVSGKPPRNKNPQNFSSSHYS